MLPDRPRSLLAAEPSSTADDVALVSCCSLSEWNLSLRLLRCGLPDSLSWASSVSGLLPSVASEEAVFLLESAFDRAEGLVGDEGFRDVALENQAKGLETLRVFGGGTMGVGLAPGGGGGGGGGG